MLADLRDRLTMLREEAGSCDITYSCRNLRFPEADSSICGLNTSCN